mgnify:CR=1 FL=1
MTVPAFVAEAQRRWLTACVRPTCPQQSEGGAVGGYCTEHLGSLTSGQRQYQKRCVALGQETSKDWRRLTGRRFEMG